MWRAVFAETSANILTINQGIPTNGAAPVTVTADMTALDTTAEVLLTRLSSIDGVIKATVVAG